MMDRHKIYYIFFFIFTAVINFLGILYVTLELLTDYIQTKCPICEDYRPFGLEGIFFTVIVIFVITVISIWQVTFQNPEHFGGEKLNKRKFEDSKFENFVKILTNPYTALFFIFCWFCIEMFLVLFFIAIFIVPNSLEITDIWLLYAIFFAIFSSIVYYFLYRNYFRMKIGVD